jgi:hypothetical protein
MAIGAHSQFHLNPEACCFSGELYAPAENILAPFAAKADAN